MSKLKDLNGVPLQVGDVCVVHFVSCPFYEDIDTIKDLKIGGLVEFRIDSCDKVSAYCYSDDKGHLHTCYLWPDCLEIIGDVR